ncbi:cytochrome P450 [Sphaerisporangium sp. NPDC005289]|uniref:cytochrome P450 n=1 Tax=Sphaerisporangium sp. NPDC005289 TaxID=3155247 RepID=UPI0033A8CDA6
MIVAISVLVVFLSLPYWLPRTVVALRVWIFARVNGAEGITVPGGRLGPSRFMQLYSHPAANGRSKGAALSDLFWYWLSPGPELHQEHLEPGPRYEEVARCTRRILRMPSRTADDLAVRSVEAALPGRIGLVRLRDLVMPVWADLYYRVVFGRECPEQVRRMIVANADDVVTALKCSGLRHMRRRLRLTDHLESVLDEVPHELPGPFSRRERALYLHGTFFTTAVVQSSEATAHVLMMLARHQDTQEQAVTDEKLLAHVIEETFRIFPLFGIAHRVTSADIMLDDPTIPVIPAGSVLCFDYLRYQRSGYHDPDTFDPWREERPTCIPFGVAANRPCPAWHLAPLTVQGVVRELLGRYAFATSAGHTRSLPNRGPCLVTPRAASPSRPRPALMAAMRVRDRWEDVGRSVVQLFLGTFMVWHARRLRLCARYFAAEESRAQPAGRPAG